MVAVPIDPDGAELDTPPPLDDEGTAALVRAMTDTKLRPPSFIDAGYTYFGQFISHDIVQDPRPGKRRLMLGYAMNLDSLYGSSTTAQLTTQGLFPMSDSGDLQRNAAGSACIPERRNNDNVIVSQLHVLWQHFHNFLITSGCAANAHEARRLLTLVFQLLVVEDFMRQVLDPNVFRSYFHPRPVAGTKADRHWLGFHPHVMPLHFSHAAFRFGHSMVRPSYTAFPKAPLVPLSTLFASQDKLPPELVVDWSGFFGAPATENGAQKAMEIDPFITLPMTEIPTAPLTTPGPVNIIAANLKAAKEVRLPSGYGYLNEVFGGPNGNAIRNQFGLEPLTRLGDRFGTALTGSSVTIANLPLWPYLLCEAKQASGGRHLGVLGSLICAEVIANSIAAAQHSIYPKKPVSIESVLSTLGPLQKRIETARSSQPGTAHRERTFCLRHIIDLIRTHEST